VRTTAESLYTGLFTLVFQSRDVGVSGRAALALQTQDFRLASHHRGQLMRCSDGSIRM
jgi:hypothetical protein